MECRADEGRSGERLLASAPRSHNTRGRKVRARPASAQPSATAPKTPATNNNAVGGPSRRRNEYWLKHVPPPWDECSNNGDCSSKSGSISGGNDGADGYYRGRGLRPASSGKGARVPTAAAAAVALTGNLELPARMGVHGKYGDDYCAAGMDVAARRALATRATAAAVKAGEVAGMIPKTSSRKGFMPGGAGRPYMSRADRAAEESKEVVHLRSEAEFWRGEAGAARQEAARACKRLETQEQHIARVLQKTAEVVPAYCYGLEFGGCSGPEELAGEQQLSVLEHRKELEKVLIVRRLKGQVSRLLERLVVAEEELVRVKRSCEFTALTEMRSTGEEYVHEIERLRAMLGEHWKPTDLLPAKPRDFRQPVVDIPPVVSRSPPSAKPPNPGETASSLDLASSTLESADQPDPPLSSDGGQSPSPSPVLGSIRPQKNGPQGSRGGQSDQQLQHYQTSQQRRCSHHHRPYSSPQKTTHPSKDAQYVLNREPAHTHRGGGDIGDIQQSNISPRREYVYPLYQQRVLAATPSGVPSHLSRTPGEGEDRNRRRRQRGRRGESVARSRARAGLLGVPGPVGSQGYITVDAPLRGGAPDPGGTGGPRHGDHRGGADREGPVAAGGRVPMTTEMEMDVMKGLVLAQHQRIERQRGRMQELERDLRDYRRATVGGGEWPQATRTPSTFLRSASPSLTRGLTPSRSAPAGLHDFAPENGAAPVNTTTAFARTQSLRAHSGGSRAPTAAQRRAEASRRLEEAAWLKLKEASRIDGWGEGGGGAAPTDVSLAMNRPRTAAASAAAAVGSALTKAWCGRDLGGGIEGKPRPKSASSRFSTSPGRRRVHRAGGSKTKKGNRVNGEGGGAGCEEEDCLPEGWAEALDNDTGHVYYFSDKRSMWVKPTRPASPRTPVSSEGGVVANADELTGVAVSLVDAATGLAYSRLVTSAENSKGDEEEENEEERREGEQDEEGWAADGRRGVDERKVVEGRVGSEEEEPITQTTVPTPLAVGTEIGTDGAQDSPTRKGRRGMSERGGSRVEAEHVSRQARSGTLCNSGGLGGEEAGTEGPQRLAGGRPGYFVERHVSNQKTSEHEMSYGCDHTSDNESLDRNNGGLLGQGVRDAQHPNRAVEGEEGLPTSVGDDDAHGRYRQTPLALDEPHLPRSSASTGVRLFLRQENEDSPQLAHAVTAQAKGSASSKPPDFERHNNIYSTASPNEGVGKSAGGVSGCQTKTPPSRRHRDKEPGVNDTEVNGNVSVANGYTPPRPPEPVSFVDTPAVTIAPSSATVHADPACLQTAGGHVGHNNLVASDCGEHPLSLEETETAMAALIATLRSESNAPLFREPSSPSLALAPLDRDPLDTSSRGPARRSSSPFPFIHDEAVTDAEPLSPQLHPTQNRLQRREESYDACSPVANPPLPVDRHHLAQHIIGGNEHGSVVDGQKRHRRFPETGKTAGEGVGYGNDVSRGVLDIEVSGGFRGGSAGGGEGGQGRASEAATGAYENDFDDD